jgi:polysaccharide pyruvyl transferase CsaB
VEFTVFSADPRDTQQRHGLRAVDRMKLSSLRQTLRESDLLLSGGGSLLQDSTSLRSLLYYLGVIRLARACGTPVMFYAQGIGPLRRRIARVMTRLAANRTQYITVRDPDSARLLRQIGVRKPPIEVTADPAFALTPEETTRGIEILGARRAGAEGEGGARQIGIALRPWRPLEPTVADYARMAEAVRERTGARLLFLPMQSPGDTQLAERVAQAVPGDVCVVREPLSPREMLYVIEALSGLMAMRLHALIFGAMGGVPLVALGYDPKVTRLMEDLGQGSRTIDPGRFDGKMAAEQMVDALAEGAALRQHLRSCASEQAQRALLNVDRALTLI